MKVNVLFQGSFILLLMLFGPIVKAQHKFTNYPSIQLEELDKKKSNLNEDAYAEILYDSYKIEVDRDNNFTKTVFRKIKIYNKEIAEGKGLLQLELPLLHKEDKSEKLLSLKASVYSLINGNEILSEKVEKNSKIHDVVSLNFSKVKNGSIIEYNYVIYSPFNYRFPTYYFQENIPIVYEEYLFEYPSFLGYNYNFKGEMQPKILEMDTMQNGDLNYNFIHLGFENVPKMVQENFVKNRFNYVTSIQPELNAYNYGNGDKNLALKWQDVQKVLSQHEKFGVEIGKQRLVKNFLPDSIRNEKDYVEKIKKTLVFVQKRTNWNGKYSMLVNKGIRSLISDGSGNSAEINLLLLMCLKELEIETYPVLISTTNRSAIDPNLPNVYCGNHVIVAVKLPSDTTFHHLDATSKISVIDVLPAQVYNETGIRLEEHDAIPFELENKIFSITYLSIEAKIDEKQKVLLGSFEELNQNTGAVEKQIFFESNKNDLKKFYEEGYPIKIAKITSGVKDDHDFSSVMKFSTDKFIDMSSGKIKINPFLFLFKPVHEFNQESERVFPIEFNAPQIVKKKVRFEIPDGYKVEKLPSLKKINTPDREIIYLAKYKIENNEIVVESHLEIREDYFPAAYFPTFQQIFNSLTTTESQVIQLVKL